MKNTDSRHLLVQYGELFLLMRAENICASWLLAVVFAVC